MKKIGDETNRVKMRISRVDVLGDIDGGYAEVNIDDRSTQGVRRIRMKLSHEELGKVLLGGEVIVEMTEQVFLKE